MGVAASKVGALLVRVGDATGGAEKPGVTTAPQAGAIHAEVLFFPDGDLPCRNFLATGRCRFGARCKYTHAETNLVKLIKHLHSARKTLAICVFNITCDDIASAILSAHKRGVKVRIITDDDQATSQGSDIQQLARAGIACVADNSSFHMHHKFAVIDGRVLLNGSLNWTVQGVKSNQENVMVTTDAAFVQIFEAQFERMWRQFANNRV